MSTKNYLEDKIKYMSCASAEKENIEWSKLRKQGILGQGNSGESIAQIW